MLGELTKAQVDELLRGEQVGRVGCHADGLTYVVPMKYVYDGECIYGRSADGMKIRFMRANPAVCFEVDHVDNVFRWRSALAQGTYEELSGPDEERATELLRARFGVTPASDLAQPPPEQGHPAKLRTIAFRIRVSELSGRFETP